MDDIIPREQAIIDSAQDLRDCFEAIQQNKSNYQITNLVVAQHPTPGRQWLQAVLELQIRVFAIKRAQLDVEKMEIDIEELERSKRGMFLAGTQRRKMQIEIEKLRLSIDEINLARLGAIRESECLYGIIQQFPKYTREQLDAEEPLYWRMRFEIQALEDMKATGTVSVGNLDVIRQITNGLITTPQTPLLADGQLEAISALGA